MFWTVPLSIIRSFSLYTQQWYTSYRFADSLWGGSILILLASCQQTCMTYTIAVCTVNNSWWWTEELSKTCRVSFQNKFEKLVHLVGFITRKNGAALRWTDLVRTVFPNKLVASYAADTPSATCTSATFVRWRTWSILTIVRKTCQIWQRLLVHFYTVSLWTSRTWNLAVGRFPIARCGVLTKLVTQDISWFFYSKTI